ncbi:uncharacterized protein TNCV_1818941 [Trichonephila clavipes]|nr:uncharacterized protein TNCV_1818941 [Trichonephila clavipes]
MILLGLSQEGLEAPIVTEDRALGPVGPYLKTSLIVYGTRASLNRGDYITSYLKQTENQFLILCFLVHGTTPNGGVEGWPSRAAHVMGTADPNAPQPSAFLWFEKTQGTLVKEIPVPEWPPMKHLAARMHFLRYGGLLGDWRAWELRVNEKFAQFCVTVENRMEIPPSPTGLSPCAFHVPLDEIGENITIEESYYPANKRYYSSYGSNDETNCFTCSKFLRNWRNMSSSLHHGKRANTVLSWHVSIHHQVVLSQLLSPSF